jgi:hypothetical protein
MSPRLSHARRAVRTLVPCLVGLCAWPQHSSAEELGVATYVRTDSDDTTVVAPRLRGKAELSDETSVSLTYAADVWTSASIDIKTSASQRPVTEQRDEIDLSVDHAIPDLTFTAGYRFSHEPDYVSHGVSGGFGYEFAQKNAQLGVGLSASSDSVGRAGDEQFSRSVGTFGARLSLTQVLSTDDLLQGMYELSRTSGYLASPYRYVPIGGNGLCNGTAPLCVPEVNPDSRLRHAASIQLRHALGSEWSVGGGYRFYTDDWGIGAHTVRADLAFAPGDTILSLRYRFYTQGSADHYQQTYDELQPLVTTDKELSSLSSHRIELELEQSFDYRDGRSLVFTLSVAPLFYSYDEFTPLDSITAFETNVAVLVTL